MNPKQKNEFRKLLAELSAPDRKELLREAQTLRESTQKLSKHPRARWTAEQWALQLLKDRQPQDAAFGTVVSISRERCKVRFQGEERDCTMVREIGEKQQALLAPGDEVRLNPFGDGWRVEAVQPRRTELARRDPGARQLTRTIVANVDVVAVVVSVVSPPLHPRLIDRYLAAIIPGGAQAILIVNKTDLCTPEELHRELEEVRLYESIGIPVFPVSTETGEGVEEVRNRLGGALCAFVGHSGVGKSSLVAALIPDSGAVAGDVSAVTGKGRHTTTGSTLIESNGLRVIDTPGIREFAPVFGSAEDVANAFPEFAEVGRCRYGNCLHRREPDCAVRTAVREQRLPMPRYAMYRRLLAEVMGEGEEEPPDSFSCIGCGNMISATGGGTAHRNHCPRCLASKHLDEVPGDRASVCEGLMEPIAVWVRKGGEWAIVHRCRECGKLASNRIAADDNETLLLSLAVRPLSNPPFPLWSVAGP